MISGGGCSASLLRDDWSRADCEKRTTAYQSVEVYVPSTGQLCQLPDLPDRRWLHTMEKMMVCGGEDTKTSCLTLTGDGWENTTEMMIRKMFNTNENITTEVGSGR